ncbi:MAG TPA: NlpC/P60 family protein [Jatrophihabitans sp.]|jgi:cell wall-associated NlpC family hydrolase|nr:NlpC/P60 family protein [Jatrophihabitans sp.]
MRLVRPIFASLVVTAAVLVAPMAAQALPHPQTPKTSAQVNVKLHELAKSSEKLAEQLNQAQIDVRVAQRAAAQATREATAAQVRAHTAQRLLAASLASQYKASSFSRTAALLASSSTDGYLQTIQSMNLLTQHQSTVALTASKAIATSNAAAARAKAAVATALAKRAVIAKRQADLKREVAKYKALLATLTAAERAKYYNPVPQPSAATVARVVSRAVTRTVTPTVVVDTARITPAPPARPASRGAGAAVSAARAQLGKPYSWGGSGPYSFDCSGLTAWAWRAAGVSLPHNAASQRGSGSSVSRGDLQPGDLVFFGSPAYHVGIYIGDGMMIHAPTTGDVVKVSSLSYMSDYSGAVRVG